MRPLLTLFILLLSFSIHAQHQYEVSRNSDNEKILKGIISRDLIAKDTAFPWYAENEKGYTPFPKAVEGLKNHPEYELLVFMGTWCHDSHFIIPKFYKLVDAAGFPANQITLIGTDEQKKTLSHLAEALGVKNVPTIIVLKDGKELGRVVEYGKYGMFDMELAEVLEGK
ncbi:MAG: thioredoxin family protein [Chitinophagaceae bacterium]|nr:thioredoxin family protein [Chitinophagaceae bacterium]